MGAAAVEANLDTHRKDILEMGMDEEGEEEIVKRHLVMAPCTLCTLRTYTIVNPFAYTFLPGLVSPLATEGTQRSVSERLTVLYLH